MRGLRGHLTYANVMASIALFVSLGGGAYAAVVLPAGSVGTSTIKNAAVTSHKLANRSVTAAKIARGAITGAQIDAATLGMVPSAAHATSADSATTADTATTATSADTATNATMLGGLTPSAFQSRISGTCADGAAISQVNADGTVGCTNVQSSSARIVTGLISPQTEVTVLTIPGVAHLEAAECTASAATAVLLNDDIGNVSLWNDSADTFEYSGDDWSSITTPQVVQSGNGTIWELGVGTGPGAEVLQVTADESILGDNQCIFQASAQVITASN